jgi:hypothetical protein
MVTEKSPKSLKIFNCELCDYKCFKKSEYNKHLATYKHKANILGDTKISINIFTCDFCKKTYNSRNGLWKHNKICNINEKTENIVVIQDASANEIKVLTSLVLEVVKTNTELQKQNQEFQKQNHELQKQVLDVCKNIQPGTINNINTNNTTNNNNKTFNLNFFLNEQCKDAMNINDFIKSIKIDITDLERLGKEGYVEGFSRIILERLKEMDIYKRPLHCSDAKRETMYIKENDVWNKDESPNNEKMIEFIKAVEQRNYTSLLAYADEYPEVYKQESKRNVPYLHMAMQSNGTAEKINKVMKRIIKEVVINKDN